MQALDVIWEDPHGVAVNKPAGLLTQPAGPPSAEVTLEALVRQHLRPDDPASVYLGTVHRLDRPVSGVVLWAKTPKAARRWAEQFAGRRTRKEYWAVVDRPASEWPTGLMRWDDWLTRPNQAGRAQVVAAATPAAVLAATQVRRGEPARLIAPGPYAWLELYPSTGRTHQLRAQTASRGIPIVGDLTYGSRTAFAEGIALHARSLTIEHPTRHTALTFRAELPVCWSCWLTVA